MMLLGGLVWQRRNIHARIRIKKIDGLQMETNLQQANDAENHIWRQASKDFKLSKAYHESKSRCMGPEDGTFSTGMTGQSSSRGT